MKFCNIRIRGLSPVLMHRFTDAAAEQATTGIRRPRDKDLTPREICETLVYKDEKGVIGFPGSNLYRGVVDAGGFVKDGRSKLTTTRTSKIPAMVWMETVFVPIDPQEWEVDSRPVVIPATNGRIIQHRPCFFPPWELEFDLSFDPNEISEATLRELMTHMGSRVGVGDYRPIKKGIFGRFTVSHFQILDESPHVKKAAIKPRRKAA